MVGKAHGWWALYKKVETTKGYFSGRYYQKVTRAGNLMNNH